MKQIPIQIPTIKNMVCINGIVIYHAQTLHYVIIDANYSYSNIKSYYYSTNDTVSSYYDNNSNYIKSNHFNTNNINTNYMQATSIPTLTETCWNGIYAAAFALRFTYDYLIQSIEHVSDHTVY
eukprot:461187_1